jgi:hypothetical protein
MSALANILVSSLLDVTFINGSTTSATLAADKTYAPAGLVAPDVNRYVDRSSGIEALFPRYDFSVRSAKNGSRNVKIIEQLTLPIANINSPSGGSGIQPLPSVGYSLSSRREITIPDVALAADRLMFWSLLTSFGLTTIYASDSNPTQTVASPLRDAILTGDRPF